MFSRNGQGPDSHQQDDRLSTGCFFLGISAGIVLGTLLKIIFGS